MIRTLNVLALAALIGSATAAYSVKYETILVSEKLKKRESELHRETDAILVLKAEWQLLNRPGRLQAFADQQSGLLPLSGRQVARAIDIPQAAQEADTIAKTFDSLLTGSIPTPDPARKSTGRTPQAGQAALSLPPAHKAPALNATPRPPNAAKPAQNARLADPAKARPADPAVPRPPAGLAPSAPIEQASENATPRPDLISRALGLIGIGGTSRAPAR